MKKNRMKFLIIEFLLLLLAVFFVCIFVIPMLLRFPVYMGLPEYGS